MFYSSKKMKKPLVLLWKILKKSKNHYKTCGFLRKKVVKPISINGFGPCVTHTRLDKLWGTLTAKLFRETQDMRKNQLKNNFWGILTCIGEFQPGNKTIYVVFDEESEFSGPRTPKLSLDQVF